MPNWVESKITISGPEADLDKMITQLSQPYEVEYEDWQDGEVKTSTETGVFLLWNIVHPAEEDLDLYYQRAEREMRKAERAKFAQSQETPKDPTEVMAEVGAAIQAAAAKVNMEDITARIEFDMAFGQDWYNWNVRNWGTKWEIGDKASRERVSPTKVVYHTTSAWSPPATAIDQLAAQYPSLTITLLCHDEMDCFAGEIHWSEGQMTFDQDREITHYLVEEIYGYCHLCANESDFADDPDYAEDYAKAMASYGCPKEKP